MNDLNDRGQRILQNFGVVIGGGGLALIGWEAIHEGDWHLWLGFLMVVVGAVCIWPPIVTPFASLASGSVACRDPSHRRFM